MNRKWAAIGVAGALVVGGLAFAGYRFYLNEATDEAVELVPKNAMFYGNLFFNPSTRQKQALRDLLKRFPVAGTPRESEDALAEFLDEGLRDFGLTFEADIQPLLGRQAAIAVLPPSDADENGVLDDDETGVIGYFGTTDAGEAMDLVVDAAERAGVETNEGSYKGIDYRELPDGNVVGPVEGFLVLGDRAADFRAAVDASEGESLASSAEFEDATASLPEDKVALAYFSWPVAIEAAVDAGQLPPEAAERVPYLRDLEPVAAAAYLRPDGLVIQAATRTGGEDSLADPGAIADVPRDAWAAMGVHDLGGTIQRLLPQAQRAFGSFLGAGLAVQFQSFTGLELQADVLAWMGDAAWFLRGSDRVEGGLAIETKDADVSIESVQRLGTRLQEQGFPLNVETFGARGASLTLVDRSIPEYTQVIANRDRVWFTYGNETAESIEGETTLQDSDTFQAAESALEDFSMTGFLDVQGVIGIVERTYERDNGPLPSTYVSEVKPNLEPLSYVVLGTRKLNEVTTVRLMIGVE